jgi:F-type H+-transporting ATPase subunit epsilon
VVVTVLSDLAELATEIDEARAKQAEERAKAETTQKVDKLDTQLAEMALSRAVARLKAVEIARERRRGR